MKILFLRSGQSNDDSYMIRAQKEGFEYFSFSPITKTELSDDRLVDQLNQLDKFNGIIFTSVSTGSVSLKTLKNFF